MSKLVLSLSIVLLSLAFVGCSDDPAGTIGMATVIIDPTPGGASVAWRLSGLSSHSGVGSKQVEVYPGIYVFSWVEDEEWINIGTTVETFTVESGDRHRVEGSFFRDIPAFVRVDAEPDELNQTWVVTTSDGQEISGAGDSVFPIDHSGLVSIQWGEQPGWWSPVLSSVSQFALGDTAAFAGSYQEILEDPQDLSVCLPSGSFLMGSPDSELGHERDELQHEVSLSHRVWIDKVELATWSYLSRAIRATLQDAAYMEIFTTLYHPLTWTDTLLYDDNDNIIVIVNYTDAASGGSLVSAVDIYDRLEGSEVFLARIAPQQVVVNTNPSMGVTPLTNIGQAVFGPVYGVTWYGAAAYCDWLNIDSGYPLSYNHVTWDVVDGDPYELQGYRLPTEAEWEYACRSGVTTAFASGDILQSNVGDRNLDLIGWYGGAGEVRLGGLKVPNSFGLYDMHGNLWEWCNDYYNYHEYAMSDAVDPRGPSTGIDRCKRGGAISSDAVQCRSANRSAFHPDQRSEIGLRPVRTHFE